MRCVLPCLRPATVLVGGLLVIAIAGGRSARAADAPPAEAARRAGLRVLEGKHLTLVTDRPQRADDGIDELPDVFTAAVSSWCRHYGIDPDECAGWRAHGCLMIDRERFRAAGLLPDDGSVPGFENGFCAGNRFWMMDQSNPDYRRHLLLHEGVHAFTLTVLRADAPPWYTEGIAEYLATHRLERNAAGAVKFIPTPIPGSRSDVGQLGRIERIRMLRRAHEMPGLDDIFATPPADHRDIAAYSSSWAAVALLAGHPAHRAAFAGCERGPLDRDTTARLTSGPSWDGSRAQRDFDAFTDELDYGFDFARSSVDWSPGRESMGRDRVAVDARRGWQNSGVALAAGRSYAITVSGTIRVGELSACADAPLTVLSSTPEGISQRWYRGRPAGRLLAAQWVERPAAGGRPRFEVLGEGARATLTARTDGPLYLKVNESPGDLADNAGDFNAEIAPAP